MSQEQDEEIRALESLFESDGWRLFIRAQKEVLNSLRGTSLDSIKTIEQLHYMKGFLSALDGVVNYEKLIEAQKQNKDDSI